MTFRAPAEGRARHSHHPQAASNHDRHDAQPAGLPIARGILEDHAERSDGYCSGIVRVAGVPLAPTDGEDAVRVCGRITGCVPRPRPSASPATPTARSPAETTVPWRLAAWRGT